MTRDSQDTPGRPTTIVGRLRMRADNVELGLSRAHDLAEAARRRAVQLAWNGEAAPKVTEALVQVTLRRD